jgi:hypothetical protein
MDFSDKPIRGNPNNTFPSRANALSLFANQQREEGGLLQSWKNDGTVKLNSFGMYEHVWYLGWYLGTSGTSGSSCCYPSLIPDPEPIHCGESVFLFVLGSCEDSFYTWGLAKDEFEMEIGSLNKRVGKEVIFTAPSCGVGCHSPATVTLFCNIKGVPFIMAAVNFLFRVCPRQDSATLQATKEEIHCGESTSLHLELCDDRDGSSGTSGDDGSLGCQGCYHDGKPGTPGSYSWEIEDNEDGRRGTLRPEDNEDGRRVEATPSLDVPYIYTAPECGIDCVSPNKIIVKCLTETMGSTEWIKIEIASIEIEILSCPETVAIGHVTHQMNINEMQGLTATAGLCGANYTWSLSGGGTLVPSADSLTALYTAPAANPNCSENATITLTCGEGPDLKTDTLQIAITAVTRGGSASIIKTCYNGSEICASGCGCFGIQGKTYWCDGTPRTDTTCGSPTPTCINYGPPPYTYDNCAVPWALYCNSPYYGSPSCEAALLRDCTGYPGGLGTTDIRTPDMIAAGCCPASLL